MKKCPFCGADIEDSARFCLYCMQSLTEKEQILPYKRKKPQRLIIIAAIIVAAVMSMGVAIMLFGKQAAPDKGTSSEGQPFNSAPSSSPTEPSDVPLVTDPPHIHNYCIENTAAEYLRDEATCTVPAIFYYSCACGEKGSTTFSYGKTANHTIVTDWGYPATCVKVGLTDGNHCSTCNAVFLSQAQIPVVNHTFDNDQDDSCNVCNYVRALNCNHLETITLTAVSPTCIAGGLTEGRKCALCEEILTAQITLAPLGHTEVIDPAVAATCTTDGKTEGQHCSACDAVLVAQVTVDAKGHNVVVDRVVSATCTTSGLTEGQHCSICNTILVAQIIVAAKGHTEVIDPAVVATCTTGGLTEGKHCAICTTVLAPQVVVAVKGHIEVIDPAVSATCIASGLTEGKHCAICTTVLAPQVVVAAKGHIEVIDPAVVATCTTGGLTEGKHCAICTTVLAPQVVVAAKGHIEVIDPAVAATCTTSGLTEGKHCAICTTVLAPQVVVAAKGHIEVIDPAVSATCIASGLTEGKRCAVCQIVLVYQQYVPALGHSFDSENPANPCSRCGIIPHIHSFTEQNTDAKYLKTAAECTTPARYYYSCNCGEKGDDWFYYGYGTGHTVVTEPGYPAGCVTPGLTKATYCSVCKDGFDSPMEIDPVGHTFALGDSPSACLVCGEMGTVTIQFTQIPIFQNDSYRIDRCTYAIRPSSDEKWLIDVSITYTNITNTTSPVADISLYLCELGYGYGSGRLMPLEPQESDVCSFSVYVPNSCSEFELRFT